MQQAEVWVTGLAFGEGPRWHMGRLWVSDFYRHEVLAFDAEGGEEVVVEVPGQPSGLGWLPDGRLLVVSMTDRKLLRLEPEGLVEHADLRDVATFHCNDMVVDTQGRAYVGNLGIDIWEYAERYGREGLFEASGPLSVNLARVDPDGSVHFAATGLRLPNGSVITPDGRTLIVAETYARQLTAFSIADDGTLFDRRVWGRMEDVAPDGICLDVTGMIWAANARVPECVRIAEGGAIIDRVETSQGCFACALGGPERTTLYLITAASSHPTEAAAGRSGRIERVQVSAPGAGIS